MKTKTITSYSDPGHGWAKVKRSELEELGILNKISRFSYQRTDAKNVGWVYLEEDRDIGIYVHALKERGIELAFRSRYANRSSRIRSYESFTASEKCSNFTIAVISGPERAKVLYAEFEE